MTRSLFGDWEKTQSRGINELEFWTWKPWLWVTGQEEPRMKSMSLDLGSWVGWAHEGTQEQSCQACWWFHTDAQERIKPVATVSGSSLVPALGIKDAWVYPKQCKETKCVSSNVRWKKKERDGKLYLHDDFHYLTICPNITALVSCLKLSLMHGIMEYFISLFVFSIFFKIYNIYSI